MRFFFCLLFSRFIDAFSNHIRSSVENAITKKIMEGALKLDSLLGNLPKKIDLDSVAAMNVTFVNDPLFKSSSVEFDIDGLFVPSNETVVPRDMILGDIKYALPLGSSSKMLWISLDEDVFNSVSDLYFKVCWNTFAIILKWNLLLWLMVTSKCSFSFATSIIFS